MFGLMLFSQVPFSATGAQADFSTSFWRQICVEDEWSELDKSEIPLRRCE